MTSFLPPEATRTPSSGIFLLSVAVEKKKKKQHYYFLSISPNDKSLYIIIVMCSSYSVMISTHTIHSRLEDAPLQVL